MASFQMEAETFYEILDVSRNASDIEITRA